LRSETFATSAEIAGQIEFNLALPPEQPNAYYFGATQLYLDCNSKNIFNAYVGQVELTGRRTGVFERVSFKIPSYLEGSLKDGCEDLRVTIALNLPSDATGTYVLDDLTGLLGAGPFPRLQCVAEYKPGKFLALFGHRVSGSDEVTIPVSGENEFSPATADRGQPTRFSPGVDADAVAVSFGEEGVTWRLGKRSASASAASSLCSASQIAEARALRQAQRVKQYLGTITDETVRGTAAAVVFNTIASLGRIQRGIVQGPVEANLAGPAAAPILR